MYEVIGKEYRSSRVSVIELRFNPMKRNLGGERDMDHIIHAALRGMDVAVLEYGVKACLIFCLAREFSYELNEIILEKAIKYQSRGVLGIDLAGPESNNLELRLTETIGAGQVFVPFHWAEANANQATQSSFDPISREPNFKQCAVRVEPSR